MSDITNGRVINSPDELKALSRGTVVASPNYADAYSIVPAPAHRGVVYDSHLMNVATRQTFGNTAEMPGFFPAYVVYEFAWGQAESQDPA